MSDDLIAGESATPGEPTASTAGAGFSTRLLEWMGDEAKERPRPTLIAAFAGIGGVLAAVGIMVAVAGDDVSRGTLIGVSCAVLVGAWLLRMFVPVEALRAASVGMAVVAVPVFASTVTSDDGSSPFLTGVVLAVLAIALWSLPGFRNRHVFLALGALALVSAFGSLADGSSEVQRCEEFLDQGDYDRFDDECSDIAYDEPSLLPLPFTENFGDQGAIYLAGALVFLGATTWLDRHGRKGPATALAATGVLSAIAGAIQFAADLGGTTAALFVLLVGLVVSFVGSYGARRATTWWGAFTAAVGVVWFVGATWEPDSTASIGSMIIVSGAVLVGLAAAAAAMQGKKAATDATAQAGQTD